MLNNILQTFSFQKKQDYNKQNITETSRNITQPISKNSRLEMLKSSLRQSTNSVVRSSYNNNNEDDLNYVPQTEQLTQSFSKKKSADQSTRKLYSDLSRKVSNFENPIVSSVLTQPSQEYFKGVFDSRIVSNKDFKFVLDYLKSKFDKEIRFPLLFSTHELYGTSVNSSAEAFHKACDRKGATLTIVLDQKGNIFGGFTQINWNADDRYELDENGFLFHVKNQRIIPRDGGINKYSSSSVLKFGPTFGNGHDLCISDGCTENNNSYNDLKSTYGVNDKEITKYYLTGSKYFEVERYEVFSVEFE